jgi:hypothetical protein
MEQDYALTIIYYYDLFALETVQKVYKMKHKLFTKNTDTKKIDKLFLCKFIII